MIKDDATTNDGAIMVTVSGVKMTITGLFVKMFILSNDLYRSQSQRCTQNRGDLTPGSNLKIPNTGYHCHLNKADIQSLDFCEYKLLMKLLCTNNLSIVDECRQYFRFELLSELLCKRTEKLSRKLNVNL